LATPKYPAATRIFMSCSYFGIPSFHNGIASADLLIVRAPSLARLIASGSCSYRIVCGYPINTFGYDRRGNGVGGRRMLGDPLSLDTRIKYSNNQMTNHGHGRTARARLKSVLSPVSTGPLRKNTSQATLVLLANVVAGRGCRARKATRRIKRSVIHYAL
jgi:hypothetical protein